MKEALALIALLLLYSVVLMASGFVLGAKFVWNRSTALETKAYVEGAKDCEEFHRRAEMRDQLQGENHEQIK